jgi:hypothetical protein
VAKVAPDALVAGADQRPLSRASTHRMKIIPIRVYCWPGASPLPEDPERLLLPRD